MYDHQTIERQWQSYWDTCEIFRTPEITEDSQTVYIKPSAPFTSGDIHMGHVRSYTIGDAHARYLRARGKSVLFAFGFDSFGLPAEVEAQLRVMPTDVWVENCADRMEDQLRRLGFSFDWDRSFLSSDPEMYRWSQWLFLTLLEADLVYKEKAFVTYCYHCDTTLAKMQVDEKGGCWRCHEPVVSREREQWFLRISGYIEENKRELDELERTGAWDKTAIASQRAVEQFADDWSISRDRKWGTPIPVCYCTKCGIYPLPKESLPSIPTEPSMWALDHLAGGCGGTVHMETQTLDCHFDALWLWIAPAVSPVESRHLIDYQLGAAHDWLPAERIVAGADSGNFMYNQRIVTKMLRDLGYLNFSEPFKKATLHEMVLNNGKKMSKHLDNAVDPSALVEMFGADTVRLAAVYAAGASKTLDWNEQALEYCHQFLHDVWNHIEEIGGLQEDENDELNHLTEHLRARLLKWRAAAVKGVTANMDQVEFHKAIRGIMRFFSMIKRYHREVIEKTGIVEATDLRVEQRTLRIMLQLLTPFAPHICEELWGN